MQCMVHDVCQEMHAAMQVQVCGDLKCESGRLSAVDRLDWPLNINIRP